MRVIYVPDPANTLVGGVFRLFRHQRPQGRYFVSREELKLVLQMEPETLEWDLPKADYETVAGLALATLHRIPRVGEEFRVGRYHFTVLEADERRVIAVKIATGRMPEPLTPERKEEHRWAP